MRKVIILLVFGLMLMSSGCQGGVKSSSEDTGEDLSGDAPQKGNYFTEKVKSKNLSNNKIDMQGENEVVIYLPPSYYTSDESYPVVYFLDGYACSPLQFMGSERDKLDKLFESAPQEEFILVGVDGYTPTGGSFYVNSDISGHWEDYISKDLVSHMDSNYRTKAQSKYRGLMGYSMGGFGALNIAMRNPDVFGSTIAFAPGALDATDFESAMESWKGESGFYESYGQAFSPNKKKDSLANIPVMDGSEKDNEIIQDWLNGFGNWDKKISEYQEKEQSLLGIRICYSEADYYKWIANGCKYLDNLMTEMGVVHTAQTYTGGHIVPSAAAEDIYVPFFSGIFGS